MRKIYDNGNIGFKFFKPPTARPFTKQESKEWVSKNLPDNMPYSIGIFKDIVAIAPKTISKKRIRMALGFYTNLRQYLKSYETAECRHGLNGSTTPLTDEDREWAANRVDVGDYL